MFGLELKVDILSGMCQIIFIINEIIYCNRVATVMEKSWNFWNFKIFWNFWKSHGI